MELAMNQYDHLIKNMDADSIALLYTPDGDLGDCSAWQGFNKKVFIII